MTILDKLARFSASQALSGASGVPSSDALDLGGTQYFPQVFPVYAVVQIEASGGTSPTLQVTVQTDDTAAFSSPVSCSGPALAQASNRMQVLPVANLKRYVRLVYTQGGTSPTATVSAWLTDKP